MPTHGGWAEGAVGLAALPARLPVRVSGSCGPTLPRPLPASPSGAAPAAGRRLPGRAAAGRPPRSPPANPPPPGGGAPRAARRAGAGGSGPPAPRCALGPGGPRPRPRRAPAAGVRGPGGEAGGGLPRRPLSFPSLPFPSPRRDALGGGGAAGRPREVRQRRQGPGAAGAAALHRGGAALQLPGLHRRPDRQRARQPLRRLLRQKEDWPMHKLECSAMCAFGQNWNPSETVRLTARILAKQRTHPERTQSEKLLAVKEFESHLDKLDNEKRELIQNDIAALHHFYSKHLEYPDNAALVVLFAQVNCNGFTIEDEELSHLGSAIFPDVALMNHSCCPNVIVTYKGTLAEVRAVKEIEPGEEVFTSYIDLLYPTEDRNDRLRDSYFFNCDCRECITKEKDKEKLEIRKLSDPPSAETVRDMIKYARNVIEEFRRAKHYKSPSELLEICELSLDKMGAVFEDSNVYMLHMMYQAMGVCLYVQDWEGALRYGQKIIRPYSKHYPSYSLNVASMWLKLGRLYMALENRTAGVKALKRAIAIMEVAHGKDHPYISEIKKELEDH
ncbi:N-lysine methyltransferase SMYD2 isoform X1 [Harpia harpyja]|nr:N-lysine methyltransferase SMYD2 isoform X1 [Harpia harpyja]